MSDTELVEKLQKELEQANEKIKALEAENSALKAKLKESSLPAELPASSKPLNHVI